jgi:hypothetical protein
LPAIPLEAHTALRAWRLMGNQIDWHGLPFVLAMLEVSDPEAVVNALCDLRDHLRERDE